MKIILVRHGNHESEKEDGGLTDKGMEQSKKIAGKLNRLDIDEIYASDLKRAKKTSEIIGEKLKTPCKINPILREWESKIIKQDTKRWKKEDKERLKQLNQFIGEITLNKQEAKNVLIVAHGQLNKLVISILMNIDNKKTVPFMQDNCCVNVLEWSERFENWRLILLNDTSHLDENKSKFLESYRKNEQ